MADHAHLTSVEALDEFRASLIIYLSRARPAVEDIASDVLRLREWLQNDQKQNLQAELRRRQVKLQLAQQALSSARFANDNDPSDVEVMAVRRATQAVEEIKDKIRVLRRWDREFDNRVEPLAKQLNLIMNVLTGQMPKATAYLDRMIRTLGEYTDLKTGPAGSATSPTPLPESESDPESSPDATAPPQEDADS